MNHETSSLERFTEVRLTYAWSERASVKGQGLHDEAIFCTTVHEPERGHSRNKSCRKGQEAA